VPFARPPFSSDAFSHQLDRRSQWIGKEQSSIASLHVRILLPSCHSLLTFRTAHRSHKVSSGEILINGVNIDAYSRRDLAKVMSFTSQTSRKPRDARPPRVKLMADFLTAVLPMTIKEYVGLGSVDDYDDEGLITKALHASTADVVVDQLADGWDSYAGGMMGATLSTDDWQLPQVVPHPPTAPTLEIVSDDLAGSACEGLGASVSSEGTLVDDSSVKEDRTGLGREKRAAHVKMTGYPTTVNGEEATISFPDHSPSPCVLSGGQVRRYFGRCSALVLIWSFPPPNSGNGLRSLAV
jgi:hypothetical protein